MSQFSGKWVAPATIDETKIQIGHDVCLQGTDSAVAPIDMIKVNTMNFLEACIKPQSAFVPSAANDLVNVSYLNAAIAGQRDPKDACRLATVGPINLATNGFAAIDGVVPALDDRILVKDQAAPTENGIYLAAAGAWSRSLDANASDDTDAGPSTEVSGGMSTMILEGGANARKVYIMTADLDPGANLGVDALPFAQVPNPANFLVPERLKTTLAGGETFIDLGHKLDTVGENTEASVIMYPVGGPVQEFNVDYTLAPSGGVTRLTFAGNFAAVILAAGAGEVIVIEYSYPTA